MKTGRWFSLLSSRQRFWLFGTAAAMLAIAGLGIILEPAPEKTDATAFTVDMSIKEIAPRLDVTGQSIAHELGLPLDVSKQKPLRDLGVTSAQLQEAVEHSLSHRETMIKYYVFAAIVIGSLVFMLRLGRPDGSSIEQRRDWYPRAPYVALLLISAVIAGFLLGKSPNPMEGAVKVFKSMVGLYPDPMAKVVALLFFLLLAIIGNKMICGWACPFGALQELIYSIPILRKIKKLKLPFVVTNVIRISLFIVMLFVLFGAIGGSRGTVIYHYVNPFNLFNQDFATTSILVTVIVVLALSLAVYRPFCQLICPFGLISWAVERLSLSRIRIDKEKCTLCGACIRACPLEAAKGRVERKALQADCFSCARCLNVCPVDAIRYEFVLKGKRSPESQENS